MQKVELTAVTSPETFQHHYIVVATKKPRQAQPNSFSYPPHDQFTQSCVPQIRSRIIPYYHKGVGSTSPESHKHVRSCDMLCAVVPRQSESLVLSSGSVQGLNPSKDGLP